MIVSSLVHRNLSKRLIVSEAENRAFCPKFRQSGLERQTLS